MTEREYKTKLEGEDNEGNGWKRWKVYVLETIEKIENKVDKMEEKRKNCQLWCTQEITKLKVKSTIWGAIGGFAVSMILTLSISLGAGFLTKNVDITEHQHTQQQEDINRLEGIVDRLEKETNEQENNK